MAHASLPSIAINGTLKDNSVTATTIAPGAVAKATVGLTNVDNTADTAKPISTATQTALNAKLTAASNLSDLATPATARTNLGLGTAATMSTAQIAADSALTSTYEQPGGTGTAPVYSVLARTGNFGYGQICQMAFDATASGGLRYLAIPCSSSGWSVGDKLLVCARLEFTDQGSTYRARAWIDNPTANISLRVHNQSFSIISSPLTASVRSPGLIAKSFVVPSGTTGMILTLQMLLATGDNVIAQIGEVGIFNLTTLGLTDLA